MILRGLCGVYISPEGNPLIDILDTVHDFIHGYSIYFLQVDGGAGGPLRGDSKMKKHLTYFVMTIILVITIKSSSKTAGVSGLILDPIDLSEQTCVDQNPFKLAEFQIMD